MYRYTCSIPDIVPNKVDVDVYDKYAFIIDTVYE